MSIELIRTFEFNSAAAVVPDLADYDRVSSGWTETEFRAFDLPGRAFGGAWRGEPGMVAFEAWPYNEICVMTKGRIAIVDQHGQRREYQAGSAFFIPKGFKGEWLTLEASEKFFVGIE